MQAQSDDPPAVVSRVPREGDIIAAKYKIDRVIGQGGMGVVVAARHIDLRQPIAVKFLLPNALEMPDAVERFLREARAAAAIESEHVVRVLDVGTLETGMPFMVMEYLTGQNLSDVIQERAPMSPDEAVDYIVQACSALKVAHSLGIVHRDLKPANLFLATRADGSQSIKVLDFGLSKVTMKDGPALEQGLTATSMVIGSPYYMPPEQLRSLKHVDARGDIWALGVILYECLTGRRPFTGSSMPEVFAMILATVPPTLRSIRPELEPELEDIVLRCLEKEPGRRVQTIAELLELLQPWSLRASKPLAIASTRSSAKPLAPSLDGGPSEPPDVEPPNVGDATTSALTSMVRTRSRGPGATRAKFLAGGACALGAMLTVLFVWMRLETPAILSGASTPRAARAITQIGATTGPLERESVLAGASTQAAAPLVAPPGSAGAALELAKPEQLSAEAINAGSGSAHERSPGSKHQRSSASAPKVWVPARGKDVRDNWD